MPYIYFTDEQKLRANSVDLERYLLQNGEELIRSGPEKRLKSDKSITIRGSEWFDHAQAVKTGGGPVAFVMYHYGLSYPEAMIRLLGGEQGVVYEASPRKKEPEPKEFALPPAAADAPQLVPQAARGELSSQRSSPCTGNEAGRPLSLSHGGYPHAGRWPRCPPRRGPDREPPS